MIDVEWLRGLHVNSPDGVIHGFLGMGTEWVVLQCTHSDGMETALSIRKNHLGFHIGEVSHMLTDTPGYDMGRVNRKLRQLTETGGAETGGADLIIAPYDELYSKVISLLAAGGMPKLLSEARSSMGTVIGAMAVPFILSTAAIRRRLEDIASVDAGMDGAEPVTVNGPAFPFSGDRGKLASWARLMTEFLSEWLEQVSPDPADRADLLEDDPLYIWGGAAMDGFFTDDELPAVVEYITETFGWLPEHPMAYAYSQHAFILSNVLSTFLNEARAMRLVKLAAMLGFLFPVLDRSGNQVSDGAAIRRMRTDAPTLFEVMRGHTIG
jgi:hypothetical protein